MKIDIICIAKTKKKPFLDLFEDYKKRINWTLNIIELESKQKNAAKCQEEEASKILKHLSQQAFIIAMDERGKTMKSLSFAQKLSDIQNSGQNHIQFIIGGADGLTQELRNRADLLLSFGAQTWPHLLARVMLLEQVYRAQQILAGHPYHRE